jgi:hypothetical protein
MAETHDEALAGALLNFLSLLAVGDISSIETLSGGLLLD